MILEIDFHGGVPIYRQIMDQVRNQIMTGQMAEGEQLEQVRNLASRLKVNPMTISKAYGYLEQEGLLERKRGVGLFVASIQGTKKVEIKTEMIDSLLKQSAISAVQMDFPEKEAIELFKKHYSRYSSKKEEHDNE